MDNGNHLGRDLNRIVFSAISKPKEKQTRADLTAGALALRRLKRRYMTVKDEKQAFAVLCGENKFGENFVRLLDDPA